MNCIVCGKDDYLKIFEKGNYDVVRCSSCGMVHVDPMPTIEETKKIYQAEGKACYTKEYIEKMINKQYFEDRFKFYKDILLKYNKTGNKVLDVGCHCGEFLRILKNYGFDVHGIEVSKDMRDAVIENFNIPVYDEAFMGIQGINEKFDFISALSVLEHTPEPEKEIKKIYDLLKDEGYLLIEVPNVDSYESQAIYYYFSSTLNYWFQPTPPMHLWEFNKVTICRFLQQNGFQIVEMGTANPFEFDGGTSYIEGYYVSRERVDTLNLENEKRNLLNKMMNNKEKYLYETNIDSEILTYIGKKLINTVFKEIEVFSKAADNKTGIWLLAKKVGKVVNEEEIFNNINNTLQLMDTIEEGLNFVLESINQDNFDDAALVFNDIILAVAKIQDIIEEEVKEFNDSFIGTTNNIINKTETIVKAFNDEDFDILKIEITQYSYTFNEWKKQVNRLLINKNV